MSSTVRNASVLPPPIDNHTTTTRTTITKTPNPTPPPRITIHPATFPADTPTIHHLFTSYASNPLLTSKLSQQNFSAELAALPGCYAAPEGCVLIAWHEDVADIDAEGEESGELASKVEGDECVGKKGGKCIAIGCLALRPLPSSLPTSPSLPTANPTTPNKIAELKRLYTLPTHRNHGTGRALILAALRSAAEMGYEEVKLDTMAWMREAIALYLALGFEGVEPYYGGEVEGLMFLGKKIGGGEGEGV